MRQVKEDIRFEAAGYILRVLFLARGGIGITTFILVVENFTRALLGFFGGVCECQQREDGWQHGPEEQSYLGWRDWPCALQ